MEGAISRIGDYFISEDGKSWMVCGDFGDGLCMLVGLVEVDCGLDVAFLSHWKVRGSAPEQFTTLADVEAALETLPAWNQTPWAFKGDNIGSGMLIDCRTGKPDGKSAQVKAILQRICDKGLASRKPEAFIFKPSRTDGGCN